LLLLQAAINLNSAVFVLVLVLEVDIDVWRKDEKLIEDEYEDDDEDDPDINFLNNILEIRG